SPSLQFREANLNFYATVTDMLKRSPPPSSSIVHLPLNVHGRDFGCGDIHGAYDLVIQGMRQAQFDPKVDRLFAVGDLIDRGSGSHRTARFLAQPYVHAVRGNHEDMLMQLYSDPLVDRPIEVVEWAAKRNGLNWWLDTPADAQKDILKSIRRLPLVIQIETTRGTVGLVHADVPAGMTWQTFLQQLDEGNEQVIETALWGRTRLNSKDDSGVVGVGRLFVGHTPQWEGLQKLGNVYALDTGAVFAQLNHRDKPGARLTFANLAMKTMDLTNVRHTPADPVDVRDGIVDDSPFGNYTR
ncbi:metallophosphoesterase, partial [Pseudomonas sp. FW306-2-2C-B10A]